MIPSKTPALPDPSYQYQAGKSDKPEPGSGGQTYVKLSSSGTTLRNRKDCSAEKAVSEWHIDVQQPTASTLSITNWRSLDNSECQPTAEQPDVQQPTVFTYPTREELAQQEREQKAEELGRLRTFRDAISRSEALSILNKHDYNYMRIAARHGFSDIIHYLVENQMQEVYKVSEYAPIWEATNSGHLKIVDYLTDHGLDKDNTYHVCRDLYGLDNLITAVASSDQMDTDSEIEMVELLLAKGEPVDGYGLITPAFVANSKNKSELVAFLKKHGANPEGLKKLNCDKVQKITDIEFAEEVRNFNLENLKVRDVFVFLSEFGETEQINSQDSKTDEREDRKEMPEPIPRFFHCKSIREGKSAAINPRTDEKASYNSDVVEATARDSQLRPDVHSVQASPLAPVLQRDDTAPSSYQEAMRSTNVHSVQAPPLAPEHLRDDAPPPSYADVMRSN
ncbi:hypothetical protein ACTL6P_08650 [Endozoicomonas acroporae]|uniref:ankyrin repeat domain-containing protein n=1 Tax=Endozoicomonas acroporae TaxID=1701104 RepID=UPI000C787AB5|nr:hypothetical protein [Endozoicomonas acroporae]